MRLPIARHLRRTQSRVILDVRPGYAWGPALLRALHLTHSSEPCVIRTWAKISVNSEILDVWPYTPSAVALRAMAWQAGCLRTLASYLPLSEPWTL